MKKFAVVFILAFSLLSNLMAASYLLDSRKSIDLSGIKKIRFELDTPNGVMSFSSVKQDYFFSSGSSGNLVLTLEGSVSSSDKRAVSGLFSDKGGDTLTIRLCEKGSFYLFLAQGGTAHLSALIPADYSGSVEIAVSSGYTKVSCLSALSLDVKSSSGDIDGDSILCKEDLSVKASSGNIKIGSVVASDASISSSSGNIEIGELACKKSLSLHASSGRITARNLASDTFSVTSSTGKVSLDALVAEKSTVKASSGNVTIGNLTGELKCDLSSGDANVSALVLDGPIDIENSSGNITLSLPSRSAFTASLRTSSGKIRNDFALVGNVAKNDEQSMAGDANGGGAMILLKASSGDIKMQKSPE